MQSQINSQKQSNNFQYDNNIFATIKEYVSPMNIVSLFGLEVSPSGFIHCISHTDKKPSMKIYDKNFKCFSCGALYDVISFVKEYCNCTTYNALTFINDNFNLNIDLKNNSNTYNPIVVKEEQQHKEKNLKRCKFILNTYINFIQNYKNADFSGYKKFFYSRLDECKVMYYHMSTSNGYISDEYQERIEKITLFLERRGVKIPPIDKINLFPKYQYTKILEKIL